MITAALRDRIENGEQVAGTFLPTERQLQKEFGASRTAIRKALGELVHIGWAETVPNKGVVATRGIRPGASATVALIHGPSTVCQWLGGKFLDMFREHGLQLEHLSREPDSSIEVALQTAIDHDVAGALVWSFRGFPDMDAIERAARRLPIVALDHRLGVAQTDLVTFDYEAAGAAATAQLIRQGCRRIGVTGMIDMLDNSHSLIRGYLRAMFEHGLQPLARDFVITATSGSGDPDPHPLELRFATMDRPDGYLVLQDICVPVTVEAALRHGLSIPRDLKLATIGDDIEVEVDGVGLTAISLDWAALARAAVDLLTARLSDPSRPSTTRMAPHRLIVRGLCGALPQEWSRESRSIAPSDQAPPLVGRRYHYANRWVARGETFRIL